MKAWIALVLLLTGLALSLGWVARQGPAEVRLAGYTTSLDGRTRSQRHNALEALAQLDGVEIAPGATFSYNRTVGTWSRDAGYRKAPVSYNGQLIWTWGGGVCQTSTTLYNAALLSGMDITERHRHHFAPGYVPPGRDAAVAYQAIDLQFRNPYDFPVRIQAALQHNSLLIEFFGAAPVPGRISIQTEYHEIRHPATLGSGPRDTSGLLVNPGKVGFSVSTYRIIQGATGTQRELLSEDDYPAMARVIAHPDR